MSTALETALASQERRVKLLREQLAEQERRLAELRARAEAAKKDRSN